MTSNNTWNTLNILNTLKKKILYFFRFWGDLYLFCLKHFLFFFFFAHHAVQMHFKQFLLMFKLWSWCVWSARLLWTYHMLKEWILTFVFSKWLFNWKSKYLMSYFYAEGRREKKNPVFHSQAKLMLESGTSSGVSWWLLTVISANIACIQDTLGRVLVCTPALLPAPSTLPTPLHIYPVSSIATGKHLCLWSFIQVLTPSTYLGKIWVLLT